MDGSDSKCQSGIIHPVLLWCDSLMCLLSMCMRVNQSRHDHTTLQIHGVSLLGNFQRIGLTHGDDAVPFDQDGLMFLNQRGGHGENPCIAQRNHARRLVMRDLHTKMRGGCLWSCRVLWVRKCLHGNGEGIKAVAQSPVKCVAFASKVNPLACFFGGSQHGQSFLIRAQMHDISC